MKTSAIGLLVLFCLGLLPATGLGQARNFDAYPDNIGNYLDRLYRQSARTHAYQPNGPETFDQWQRKTRTLLCQQMGLDKIAASVGNHRLKVELGPAEDLGQYTRHHGTIETEPDVRISFWLLKPKGDGPWPLGIFPHGHSHHGSDTTAGIYANEAERKKALAEDRDVAVQAVLHGYLAIAPAVRGLAADAIPDLYNRHGGRPCRSHVMHCLLAGRTAIGERVWDMQRLLDWALTLPELDKRHVLMMGNSGGGMVTLFAAACDKRIEVAVPSCSFAPSVSASGYIFHCDCNMIPGLLELDGLPGVAGLIAPRYLLTVNGRLDPLFSEPEIDRAVVRVRALYQYAGAPDRYAHRWGDAGHRFYKDLMWPFILDAMQCRGNGDRE